MARYFFDVYDTGEVQKDDTGTEFASLNEVVNAAKRLLPDIARDEIPKNGEHRAFVVLVTDEDKGPVYSATLAYTGLWLTR